MRSLRTLDLTGRWQFKAVDPYHALPANKRQLKKWMTALIPGTVHTDLLSHGAIPDPFYRTQENEVQWVEFVQWKYRRVITVPADFLAHDRIELVAHGLDTYAEIWCNGKSIGSTANMFVEHRLDLKGFLRAGRNTLEILFDSPTVRSKALARRYGQLNVALEPHRAYVRKAQYSFGWDWGPKLTTSGIWRGIAVEAYSTARLQDAFVRIVSVSKKEAVIEASVDVKRLNRHALSLSVRLEDASWSVEKKVTVSAGHMHMKLRIPHPQLWWPNGYGSQPLYHAVLRLFCADEKLDELAVPFAIRTVRLLRQKDSSGESFIIQVNGVRIFCKGADWIPSDSFIPRISAETYETLLHLAESANMNMLRVWGGGIYEQDIFYDICDRLGLMVWQDFMFACGEYPEVAWFEDLVRDEAEKAVKRLRNHPSIAIWCGNNECEWLFSMENPGKSVDAMPGARIFRTLLPSVIDEFDGTRPYWRSSPFGNGLPNGESNGNHHQWQVWSNWKDYHEYERNTARFITEFGFQAAANRRTMEAVTVAEDRFPQSGVMEHHNKQIEGTERLIRFQSAHHAVARDFDEFIYKTQLVQAEALKCAVEHWRREKFHTAGSLFWQLNDCWPVSSWSVVDSALRPKAAYYYARKFYAPLLVSFARKGDDLEVWLTSDFLEGVRGELSVTLSSFAGKTRWSTKKRIAAPANSSIRLMTIPRLPDVHTGEHYLHAQVKVGHHEVCENRYFFEEPKRLNLPETRVSAKLKSSPNGAHLLILRASRFVKNLRIEFEGLDIYLADNYVDIDAGQQRIIPFRSPVSPARLKKALRLRWLQPQPTRSDRG